ncbi:MAG: hypothetical protein HXM72_03185 [Mogibacterium diversum]|nr:hypothetical protein [Mogibacterium diversum]
MNILFMVGNGLDLQYGLKTKYTDFFDSQKTSYNKDNIIYQEIYNHFISGSEGKVAENWSDLEFEIGKLTKEKPELVDILSKQEDYISCFEEVCLDFYEYLKVAQLKFDPTNKCVDFSRLIKTIPEHLYKKDKDRWDICIDNNNLIEDTISIMTFNYTNRLDILYENSEKVFSGSLKSDKGKTTVNPIVHAHGELDNIPILGINDLSQIYDGFNLDLANYLIKKEAIDASRENHNERNFKLINEANLIIIYGMSIGETDKYFWERIARHSIDNGVPIIIYHYYNKGAWRNSHITMQRLYDLIEKRFIKLSNTTGYNEVYLRNNMLIIINSDMESKKLFVYEDLHTK